ncbi:MAG: hypothetical protein FJX76_02555 [Armatimonadetes bacterium]|nr:hypothetical protein [Armatimonadota bacterium]
MTLFTEYATVAKPMPLVPPSNAPAGQPRPLNVTGLASKPQTHAEIGKEHRILETFKKSGRIAGGTVASGLALPAGFARGAANAWTTPEGRKHVALGAKIGAVVAGGLMAATVGLVGMALLGPVGAVIQAAKAAVAGMAIGAAGGAVVGTACEGAREAVSRVPAAWKHGGEVGEAAASAAMGAGAASLIWMGENSRALHWIGMQLQLLLQSEPKGNDHKRVHEVVPGLLWRSAQPGPEVWSDLAARGFKSVINLREETNYEKEAVEAAGLKAFYIPENPLGRPTIEQALEFLQLVTDPANQPVLWHCYSGVDRTGTMAACYRIAVEGWTQEAALQEALEKGMVKELQGDKIAFIKEFNKTWQEMKVRGTAPKFP